MVRHGRIAVRLQYGLETPENPGASAERRQTLRDQEAMAVVLTADVSNVLRLAAAARVCLTNTRDGDK
jgi:hypothetical protein